MSKFEIRRISGAALFGLLAASALAAPPASSPPAPSAAPDRPSALVCPYGFASGPVVNAARTGWDYICNTAPRAAGSGTGGAGGSNGFFAWLDRLIGARQVAPPPLPLPPTPPVAPPPPVAPAPTPVATGCAETRAPAWAETSMTSGPAWDGGGATVVNSIMPAFTIPAGARGDRIRFIAYSIPENNYLNVVEGQVSGPVYIFGTPTAEGGKAYVYGVYGGAGSVGGANSYSQSWTCTANGWQLERKDVPFEGYA